MQRLFILFISSIISTLSLAVNSPELSNIQASTPTEQKLLDAAASLEKPLPQLEQELNKLIQLASAAEQNADNHLANLQVQNEQMKARLNQLDQQVVNISEPKSATSPVKSTLASFKSEEGQPVNTDNIRVKKKQNLANSDLSFWQKVRLFKDLNFISGFVILVLLLLVGFIGSEPKVKVSEKLKLNDSSVNSELEEHELEEEYDFMGSEEAIPAKLDLARAYLDMEDYDAAHGVLQDVINKGTESQRQQAQELLRQVKI